MLSDNDNESKGEIDDAKTEEIAKARVVDRLR
jgi:hypothetical protein